MSRALFVYCSHYDQVWIEHSPAPMEIELRTRERSKNPPFTLLVRLTNVLLSLLRHLSEYDRVFIDAETPDNALTPYRVENGSAVLQSFLPSLQKYIFVHFPFEWSAGRQAEAYTIPILNLTA